MTGTLEGKVAVVTGASRGMGRHISQTLADAGARVALLARPSDDLNMAHDDIGPDRALAVPCDVGDPRQVAHAFTTIAAAFGRIDILVNNAGVYQPCRIEDLTDAEIARQIGINLMAPIYCAREAIPHLRATGGGDIVNVSSESVRTPFPWLSVYAAAKGGLEVFSSGLRAELRPDRIRVTLLRSGRVAGSTGTRDWPPEVGAAFFAAIAQSGHLALAGAEEASPQTMAKALCDFLALPRDAAVEMVELRAF